MANPERGQVAIEAGGKTFTLKFSTNAICDAEAAAGKSFGQLCDGISLVDFRSMRVLLWAGLKQAHEDMTIEMAGDLLDEAEPLEVGPKLNEAIELAYPKTAGAGNAGDRPRKAAKA